jgi:hypothetical protein
MSGYAGNSDLEAEHAAILSENGVAACQSMLMGVQLNNCRDCYDPIPEARRAAAKRLGHKCEYCITCQPFHDTSRKVKMLDRIL